MSMRLNKQRLMEMAGLIYEAADYTFSGTDKFMDQVAVNVFKKHGIDQSKLNREYDANEGIVEFTVNLEDALVDKISQELEAADRGKGEYGGMMEGKKGATARFNEARVYTHDYEPRELVPRMEGMVDMAEHKKMIDSIDKCMDDWYKEGFDKNDILNYFHAVLPEGPND